MRCAHKKQALIRENIYETAIKQMIAICCWFRAFFCFARPKNNVVKKVRLALEQLLIGILYESSISGEFQVYNRNSYIVCISPQAPLIVAHSKDSIVNIFCG